MIWRTISLAVPAAGLLLLVLDGPRGAVLGGTSERGKVERDPTATATHTTARTAAATYIFMGGGYQGGK
jgi:hypothetical protein